MNNDNSNSNSGRLFLYLSAASSSVTGSNLVCTAVYPNGERIMFAVDCGLFQGRDENLTLNSDFPYKPENLQFILLTHTHVDHIGKLSEAVACGFNGQIFSSRGTALLVPNALRNSSNIILTGYKENKKRKGSRKATHSQEEDITTWTPHFSVQDIENAISMVQAGSREYGKTYRYNDHLSYTFYANQHLFGASSVLVTLSYPGCEDLNVFFTGDYNCHNLFFEVPDLPEELLNKSLTVVCEATYGDTDSTEVERRFLPYLIEALNDKKTIEYNVFALGRAQDILFMLKQCQDDGTLPFSIPIYLDGGLTVSNTFKIKENPDLFGDKAADFLPRNLTIVDRQFRPSIIENREQKIIVTTSGMGGYGPSHQYLQHFLPQRDKFIVFTGFCVPGTLGAQLMEVKKGDTFNLWGQDIQIQADVRYLEEFSAHAKRDELITYLQKFKSLKSVVINHGEPDKKEKFQFSVEKNVHPPKGTYILNRETTIRITKYGVDKKFGSKW